jgi:hypothetical protein
MINLSYNPETGLLVLSSMVGGEAVEVLGRRYLEKGLTEHEFFAKLIKAVESGDEILSGFGSLQG